jgi:hypothetical protein
VTRGNGWSQAKSRPLSNDIGVGTHHDTEDFHEAHKDSFVDLHPEK